MKVFKSWRQNRARIFIASIMSMVLVATVVPQYALACTGVYVGKDVAVNDKAIFARSEDIGSANTKLFVIHEAENYKDGEVYSDSVGFSIPYPQQSLKYSAMEDSPDAGEGGRPFGSAGTNEAGLAVSATISATPNEKIQAADPFVESGITELSIAGVVLMQCKTAREGIEFLGDIVQTTGAGEGNIIFMGDEKEVWYMEILSGHEYVATKLADDISFVLPNDYMLTTVDTKSPDVIASKNIHEVAKKAGTLTEEGGKINVKQSYAQPFGDYDVYRATAGLYLTTGVSYDPEEVRNMDLRVNPGKKLSKTDVMDILRTRYEGTKYDANLPENAGIRVIGTARQAETHLFEIQQDAGAVLAATQWQSIGNSEFSAYLPYFTSLMTETPEAYRVKDIEYNPQSAYWKVRSLATLCALDRENYGSGVRQYLDSYQDSLIASNAQIEPQLESLYNTDPKLASGFANKYAQVITSDYLSTIDSLYSQLTTHIAREQGEDERLKDIGAFVPTQLSQEIITPYSFDSILQMSAPVQNTISPDALVQDSAENAPKNIDFNPVTVLGLLAIGATLVAIVFVSMRKSEDEQD